jgi:biopolymer transport protein ExbB
MDFFSLLNIASQFRAVLEYLEQGGCIVWPLVGISVWMWYLIIKKLCMLVRWQKYMRYVSSARTVSGTSGIRILYNLLTKSESPGSFHTEPDQNMIESFVQTHRNELESHIQTIFVLASVAPLLGLLGTVTGMISTFEAISRFGTANARAFAAGISEALVTTQMGLIVAVPGIFMGHLIRKRTDNIQLRIQGAGRRMQDAGRRMQDAGRRAQDAGRR